MIRVTLRTMLATAALCGTLVAAPLAANAGGYGYGYGHGGYGHSYKTYKIHKKSHYKKYCTYKKVWVWDDYYGHYRWQKVRVCH